MMQDSTQHVLLLEDHDENQEIEFELQWFLSLTVEERFQLMIKQTQELLQLLEDNGHRRPAEIIKRASS